MCPGQHRAIEILYYATLSCRRLRAKTCFSTVWATSSYVSTQLCPPVLHATLPSAATHRDTQIGALQR